MGWFVENRFSTFALLTEFCSQPGGVGKGGVVCRGGEDRAVGAGAGIAQTAVQQGSTMSIKNYYDEQYYGRGHSDHSIKLPFSKQDYYGSPLQRLGYRSGDRLLDVACSEGQLLRRAESLGLQCWGIDISQVAIDRARIRCRATIVCADVNNGLPYDDKFFDYVTCLGSLEHFERQSYVLDEIWHVVKGLGTNLHFGSKR